MVGFHLRITGMLALIGLAVALPTAVRISKQGTSRKDPPSAEAVSPSASPELSRLSMSPSPSSTTSSNPAPVVIRLTSSSSAMLTRRQRKRKRARHFPKSEIQTTPDTEVEANDVTLAATNQIRHRRRHSRKLHRCRRCRGNRRRGCRRRHRRCLNEQRRRMKPRKGGRGRIENLLKSRKGRRSRGLRRHAGRWGLRKASRRAPVREDLVIDLVVREDGEAGRERRGGGAGAGAGRGLDRSQAKRSLSETVLQAYPRASLIGRRARDGNPGDGGARKLSKKDLLDQLHFSQRLAPPGTNGKGRQGFAPGHGAEASDSSSRAEPPATFWFQDRGAPSRRAWILPPKDYSSYYSSSSSPSHRETASRPGGGGKPAAEDVKASAAAKERVPGGLPRPDTVGESPVSREKRDSDFLLQGYDRRASLARDSDTDGQRDSLLAAYPTSTRLRRSGWPAKVSVELRLYETRRTLGRM